VIYTLLLIFSFFALGFQHSASLVFIEGEYPDYFVSQLVLDGVEIDLGRDLTIAEGHVYLIKKYRDDLDYKLKQIGYVQKFLKFFVLPFIVLFALVRFRKVPFFLPKSI